MKRIIKTILFTVLCSSSMFVYAQSKHDLDKTYQYAMQLSKQGRFDESVHYLNKIIHADSTYLDAYLLLSDIYLSEYLYDSLRVVYKQCTKFCGKKYPKSYFMLANVYFYTGEMKEALASYQKYLSLNRDENMTSIVKTQITRCQYALKLLENPVPFNPINLGNGINTVCDEYYPYISPDEKTIIFTRKVPMWEGAAPSSDNTQEDFYASYWVNNQWSKAEPLKGKVNTRKNEGAQTLTADGKYMVFTACDRPDGKGACDLYYSEKNGDTWTQARNLYTINTEAWESQPSISADGRELYFASERESGYGNSDIYMSTRLSSGLWSAPVLLDTVINTAMSETSPFIHPDGRTLYFCSNGHWGVGGYDIFMSKRDDKGKWSTPVNLGYPINTSKDEIGLVVSASGKRAYITSSRNGGYGLNDIYVFDLPEKVQAEEVTYIKGMITDEKNHQPLAASCEIVDLILNKIVFSTVSDSITGSFLMCLTKGREYAMFIDKQGYLYYSENIRFDSTYTVNDAFNKKIKLTPVANGAKMVLPNIFYETDSFLLKPTSFAELDKMVLFLNANPAIKIEIGGHTDNTGSDIYNKTLSEKRAQSVMNYLISKGIAAKRIMAVGYGSRQPLADNSSSNGKAINRRTELKIIP